MGVSLSASTPEPSSGAWIVIPVYNRRETTLLCLRNLRDSGTLNWAQVVIVDDGSTDGTGAAVRSEFPEATVLEGDGNLWWTGAIAQGMDYALKQGALFLFWLNDDCLPEPGCLRLLLDYSQKNNVTVTGQAFTDRGYVYGGRRKTPKGLEDILCGPEEIEKCDTFTGNCVVFPRRVVEHIGLPRFQQLPHSLADADYGLRITQAGFPAWILGAARCHNTHNLDPTVRSWLLSGIPLSQLWKGPFNLKSSLHLRTNWNFYTAHWGISGALMFFLPYVRLVLISLLRILIPRKFLLKLYGKRSYAWQAERNYPPIENS